MLRHVAFIFALVVLGQAQRPPYAGSAHRYPAVLPRFQDNESTASPSTIPANIGNRNDGEDSNALPSAAADPTTSTTTTTVPPNMPIDALGDVDLINRIKTWPKEKQPFWYLNSQQIESHRGVNAPTNRPIVDTKPFFSG